MNQSDPINLAKAVLWEEAKGKLRALVAADGARHSGVKDDSGRFSFEGVSDRIEAFIDAFESEGLHE